MTSTNFLEMEVWNCLTKHFVNQLGHENIIAEKRENYKYY